MKNNKMKYTEEKYFKIMQNIENDHEAQLLNDFYDQKEEKKEKLKQIRNKYRMQRIILKQKGEKINADY